VIWWNLKFWLTLMRHSRIRESIMVIEWLGNSLAICRCRGFIPNIQLWSVLTWAWHVLEQLNMINHSAVMWTLFGLVEWRGNCRFEVTHNVHAVLVQRCFWFISTWPWYAFNCLKVYNMSLILILHGLWVLPFIEYLAAFYPSLGPSLYSPGPGILLSLGGWFLRYTYRCLKVTIDYSLAMLSSYSESICPAIWMLIIKCTLNLIWSWWWRFT
jgi:hypothetical protein